MSDCLVTKLRASVNDDNLEKLGVITIKRVTTANHNADTALISTNMSVAGVKFKIIGDGYFERTIGGTSLGKEYTAGVGGDAFYSSNGDYTIEVTSKYDAVLTQLGSGNQCNVKQLYYSPSYGIRGVGYNGKISDLNPNNVTLFSAWNVLGNYDDVLKLINLSELYLPGRNIGGDIEGLSAMLSLQIIHFGYGMTGSIEDLVRAYRGNGKTSGSITTRYLNDGNGSVTFNGVRIVASPADKVLSWTASTITWDGTTINV